MLNNNTVKIFIIIILIISYQSTAGQYQNIPNQMRLAKSYELAGELEKAKDIYSNLYKQNPDNIAVFDEFNKILLKLKDYDASIKIIEQRIKNEPENITLYGQLGTTYFIKGDEKKANQIWEKGISVNSDNAFAYRTIANYMIENRAIENAIDMLKRGNKVSKNHTVFSYDLANLYALTMKYQKATEVYCNILESKPKQMGMVKSRILTYIHANGAKEPTLETVKDFYDDNEQPVFLELLAELYLKTNETEKAFESFSLLEENTTNNGSKLFRFAQIAYRTGNFKIAAKAYKKVISAFPESSLYSSAKIGYAKSLEAILLKKQIETENSWKPYEIKTKPESGNFTEIISAYKELVNQYANNNIGTEAKFRIGKIYFEYTGNTNKAKKTFTEIIKTANSNEFVNLSYYQLAKIAISENDLNLAESYLNKITTNDINIKSDAQFLLARIKTWKGNFEKAISILKQISENAKDKNSNDALEILLVLNTFKSDSTNLKKYFTADNLLIQNKFDEAANIYKELSEKKDLFILKDFAALNYARLQIALNKYQETAIFIKKILDCDAANIYEDKFLFLLGIDFYYGLKQPHEAKKILTKLLENFPTSLYYNKARKIITEIKNTERKKI